jgi:hypothetical protein
MALRGEDLALGTRPKALWNCLLLRDKECGGDPTRRGTFENYGFPRGLGRK